MEVGNAIEADGLVKSYGDTPALSGVDLVVPEGSVLGLLGPNGAGKTTAVRILTTLLRADSGRASVMGYDVFDAASKVRQVIGLAGQYAAVDETLTGAENLRMVGRLHHLPNRRVRERAWELLERFDLIDAADRAVKTYSGGMRRRLDLAASLINEPDVLFLDEPTTGLDLPSRSELWRIVEELADKGKTVLLTTQYLEEADRLADRISVVDHGRVIAEGTPEELKAQTGATLLDVRITHPDDLSVAARTLLRLSISEPITDPEKLTLTISLEKADGAAVNAIRLLDEARIEVLDALVRRPSLDDVFLALTGHTASDNDASRPDSPRRAA